MSNDQPNLGTPRSARIAKLATNLAEEHVTGATSLSSAGIEFALDPTGNTDGYILFDTDYDGHGYQQGGILRTYVLEGDSSVHDKGWDSPGSIADTDEQLAAQMTAIAMHVRAEHRAGRLSAHAGEHD